MLNLAVLVSGRGSNLQAIIDRIESGNLDAKISVVVSNTADAYGLVRAKNHGIPTRFLCSRDYSDRRDYDAALARLIENFHPDLIVLAGYMLVLTPVFLDVFPQKVINIHPALLPSFPGTHAQKQALDYGVKVSGCTVHFVDAGTDTGPIIAQRVVPVFDDDTEDTLAARILEQEHDIFATVIQWIAQGKVELKGRKVLVKE